MADEESMQRWAEGPPGHDLSRCSLAVKVYALDEVLYCVRYMRLAPFDMCDGQLLPPPSWSLGGWGLARVAPGLKHAVQSGCRAPRKAASHAKPAFLSREWLRAAVDCCWVSLLSSPAISKFADRRSSQLRRAGVNRNSASIPGNCREHRFGIFINYSGDPFPPRSNDQTRLQRAPLLKIKLPVTPSITKTSSWWGPTALGTTPPIRS